MHCARCARLTVHRSTRVLRTVRSEKEQHGDRALHDGTPRRRHAEALGERAASGWFPLRLDGAFDSESHGSQ